MMTRPAEASATNETITWREARYLARVVQMLVRSPSDRGEFRRELEHLLRAADALRAASARSAARAGQAADGDPGVYDRNIRDIRGRDLRGCDLVEKEMETATEGAVVELWRSNAQVDYERLQGTGSVAQLRQSGGRDAADKTAGHGILASGCGGDGRHARRGRQLLPVSGEEGGLRIAGASAELRLSLLRE
jgi:hypothetical protein